MSYAKNIATWDAGGPCPDCGQSWILGYRMDNEHREHMHTHYVCTFWGKGQPRPCGWHGWSVPGWDKEEEPKPSTRTGRVQVCMINWNRPDAPHAVVFVENAPIEQGGMSLYFDTFATAVAYADKLANRLYPKENP